MPNVAIVNGNSQYHNMFISNGWNVVDNLADADLVQFTGGEDVSPHLYGAEPHPTTFSNGRRDSQERALFERILSMGKPMVGICRGGQFLNVMSGGAMWQDVDGHAIGGVHMATDVCTGMTVAVSSTHHQMMKPSKAGKVLTTAAECSRRENVYPIEGTFQDDVEVVYYKDTNCLCFQPHPEFDGVEECTGYYFELIGRMLGLSAAQ